MLFKVPAVVVGSVAVGVARNGGRFGDTFEIRAEKAYCIGCGGNIKG